jgi:tetratricopeptide (TPR) repeat protein
VLRYHRLDMDWLHDRGEEACRIGEDNGDPVLQWLGHRICGTRFASLGEFPAARTHLERSLEFSEAVDAASGGTLPPEGPSAGTLFHLCRVLCCLGYPDQARARQRELLNEARGRPHFALFLGLSGACFVNWCLRSDVDAALRTADELVSVSSEQGWAQGRAWGNLFRGWCIALMGDAAAAIPLLIEGLSVYRRLGISAGMPMFLTSLAEAYGMAGQPAAGLARLEASEFPPDAEHNRWAFAETLRVRGVLQRALGHIAAAEDSFCEALAVARRQQARLWELRTALELAELLRVRGEPGAIRHLLAPLAAWFAEGAELPDLRRAREFLSDQTPAG